MAFNPVLSHHYSMRGRRSVTYLLKGGNSCHLCLGTYYAIPFPSQLPLPPTWTIPWRAICLQARLKGPLVTTYLPRSSNATHTSRRRRRCLPDCISPFCRTLSGSFNTYFNAYLHWFARLQASRIYRQLSFSAAPVGLQTCCATPLSCMRIYCGLAHHHAAARYSRSPPAARLAPPSCAWHAS